MFRENRNKLVDIAEHFIRKSGISDKTISTTMQIIHFFIPLITMLIVLFGTKFWVLLVIFYSIVVFISFFMFEGCILSSLEHRFTVEDFTVIDPLLTLINVDLTYENRYTYSIYSSILGFLLMVVIYSKRHF